MNKYEPKIGEIVSVSNDPFGDGCIYYTQKFVIKHRGLYFCERDDGISSELIGWKYCQENILGHRYYETSNRHER